MSLFPSLRTLFGARTPDASLRPRHTRRLLDVQHAWNQLRSLSTDRFSTVVHDLRSRFQQQSSDDPGGTLITSCCAATAEAARRTLSVELYEVQLLAGVVLAERTIAEVATGEGKTFIGLFPTAFRAFMGRGVHVMTVNPYLAARDQASLEPVFRMLGLTSGLVDSDMDSAERKAAYACDITYGPGYQFAFDYLRDQLELFHRAGAPLGAAVRERLAGRRTSANLMQRGLAAAIVDEADSVMIDEATTPLILASGGRECEDAAAYRAAEHIASALCEGIDYRVDQESRRLLLTNQGLQRVRANQVETRSDARRLRRRWTDYVHMALLAKHFFLEDVHYVVQDNQVQIVDTDTGRIHSERQWSEGLHQAVQAKSGVPILEENQVHARISRQKFLRLYAFLAGMTGTTQGAERELLETYALPVIRIPLRKPCRRETLPMRFFSSRAAKEIAIVDSIRERHMRGQPVLIGVGDIAASERIARLLNDREIPCQLLNGKQDAAEAAIVGSAGQSMAVTVATNMAGRGTDIPLDSRVRESLGGLHVIAAEPQPSQRVDRQLAGRSARQGDPGSYQVFVSAEDDLLSRFAPRFARQLSESGADGGEVRGSFEHAVMTAQHEAERQRRKVRSSAAARDDWMQETAQTLAAARR